MPGKVVIRKLVLDVMKPHKPSVLQVGLDISSLSGVDGCNITMIEIDKSVENIKVTVEGSDIDYSKLERALEENGATVHSIDKVSIGKAGKKLVEEADYKH